MKKIISIILLVFMVLSVSSCDGTEQNTNQSQEIYKVDSYTEISEDNETSEKQESIYYVLNTRTKKIHLPSCYYAKKISEKNYATTDDLQSAIDKGYSKCQKCHPK